jgi:membrane protein YdbS with pleckstrin-like domain
MREGVMQTIVENVTAVSHVIQLAIAPVFLLMGIGAILSVLTGRLGRIVDRFRVLTEKHDLNIPKVSLELHVLSRRAAWVHWAITLCTISALLVSAVIGTLFVGYQLNLDPSRLVSSMFILTMICLIFGLTCFLREIYLSIHAFQIRNH